MVIYDEFCKKYQSFFENEVDNERMKHSPEQESAS